jgi:type II secretory pathway component PulJ
MERGMSWDMIAVIAAMSISSLTFLGAMMIVHSDMAKSERGMRRMQQEIETAEYFSHAIREGNGHAVSH